MREPDEGPLGGVQVSVVLPAVLVQSPESAGIWDVWTAVPVVINVEDAGIGVPFTLVVALNATGMSAAVSVSQAGAAAVPLDDCVRRNFRMLLVSPARRVKEPEAPPNIRSPAVVMGLDSGVPQENEWDEVEYWSIPEGQFATDIHDPVALAVVPST